MPAPGASRHPVRALERLLSCEALVALTLLLSPSNRALKIVVFILANAQIWSLKDEH